MGAREAAAQTIRSADAGGAPTASRWRQVAGWLLLAATIVLLWPAHLGGSVGLTLVSGQSMEPTYRTGDLVVTLRQPSYDVGDIVSYVVPRGQVGEGGRVIHRITRADGGRYTTQGDNNPAADPWSFQDGDVVGGSVAVLPGVGTLWHQHSLWIMAAVAGGAFVTVVLWPSGADTAEDLQEDADA